ncbi:MULTISPECIES: ADP-ribosyltransferase [unclassified Streptomyces]|uniref:ADP-ribosyltransferase n=1 Tax=unclassified Streptomyces TaxID=2593676 RepID=UPI0036404C8E
MITSRSRRWAAAVALSVLAVLIPASATEAAATRSLAGSAPVPSAPAGSAPDTSAPARAASVEAAASCPRVEDPMYAAADHTVEVNRITPTPAWRTDCRQLYRADSRKPEVIFEQGFQPKAPVNGQYDVEKYVLVNQPSPYVSTSYDHDLYKQWYKSGFNYYIDAPGGIDVNKTIGDTHKWADQVEVAFPGGISRERIVGVCPVDKVKKTEIMSECLDNPHYQPWRG